MSSVLRPLRLGEILDQTAQLYRRNFLLFAGTAVIPTAVIFGIYIIIFAIAGFPLIVRNASAPLNPAFGGLFFVLILVAMPLLVVPMVFSQAGITRAAVSAFRGEKMKVREALASVKPRFWRYLGLLLLQGLLIVGIPMICAGVVAGALALAARFLGGAGAVLAGFIAVCVVIAGVIAVGFLLTKYSMGLATSVVEDMPAWASLKRAAKLSKGTRGRIFVMFLVMWCIMMVLSMVGYIPTLIVIGISAAIGKGSQTALIVMGAMQVVNLLINFSLQTLVSPAYLLALVMFYFDQRVRLEGYDIEWLMQQAGLNAPSQTAPEVSTVVVSSSAPEPIPSPAQEQ